MKQRVVDTTPEYSYFSFESRRGGGGKFSLTALMPIWHRQVRFIKRQLCRSGLTVLTDPTWTITGAW